MNFFKRLFRKPAIILVTLWTNINYKKGVTMAEERRKREMRSGSDGNCMIFLAKDAFHPDRLITYNKRQFKAEKRLYGVSARLLTMNTLMAGCYYHTADRWDRNGMSEREKEIRRKAFIKERLHLAKLI